MNEGAAIQEQGEKRTVPICTIAIPVYNRPELVRGAIESALSHDRQDVLVLVIDNCSTDNTYEVACSYTDPRLKVVRNDENLGLFGNFNRCLELSEGEYVCILCSDDRHREGFIESAIAAMKANPTAGIVTTRQQMHTPEGQYLRTEANHLQPGLYDGREAIKAFLRFQSHYAFNIFSLPSGCLFRKSTLDGMDPFIKEWQIVGDVELYLRMLERSDVAALDIEGVDVIYHMGQEWALNYGDPTRTKEHLFLIERYRELLGPKLYKQCLAMTCATLMALAVKHRIKGRKKAAADHWAMAKSQGIGFAGRWYALVRLVYFRAMFRAFKYRSLPITPKGAAS
jgi:glycosyltransferase involved in cell wall biosynthesis